ncbi:hypothetical protein J4Q44_G00353830 [Coregonus suidteri]|uniref:C2H2-type domain-containing protein n=1 Tax=Coregonus suidteri TaxID=861788 RepID=A0AAN8KNS8_9TELE
MAGMISLRTTMPQQQLPTGQHFRAVFASIEDSDSDLDNHDSSSNTSADDHMTSTKRTHHRGVKEESEEGADLMSSCVCPLCTLEFSSPEQLITHVYQHTSLMGSSKSYVCPVCGRALSSPGSLGRHLLIHSEDRLSNCAVCGTRFTDTNNFNREKLREVLNTGSSMECSSGDENCSMSRSLSSSPMGNPGHGLGHTATTMAQTKAQDTTLAVTQATSRDTATTRDTTPATTKDMDMAQDTAKVPDTSQATHSPRCTTASSLRPPPSLMPSAPHQAYPCCQTS